MNVSVSHYTFFYNKILKDNTIHYIAIKFYVTILPLKDIVWNNG